MMTKIREGYKETEIGVIPEDWYVVTLDKYVESNSYGPRFNAKLYDDNGNCRVIRGTDVKQNGIVDYSNIPVAQIDEDVLEKHRLLKNDFVVVTTADCGVSFVFKEDGVFMPSAYMVRLRFSNEVNIDYLCNYFETPVIKKQVASHIRKGTIANLPGSDLLRFKAPLPPLIEQQRIVEILSTIDSHIKKFDKIIEDYQLLKKGMMKKLLTEGIGHTEFKETEIGRIPKEWEVKTLEEVCEKIYIGLVTSMTKHYSDNGVLLIRNSDIKENQLLKSNMVKLTYEFADKNKSRCLQKGDVVTVHTGDIGTSAIIDDELDGCQGFATLNSRVKKNIIISEFYSDFLNSDIAKQQAYSASTGDGRNNLNLKDFVMIKIPVPINLDEQKTISNNLQFFRDRIKLLTDERNDFIELKKSLMEKLLTGKVRTC